MKIKWCDLTLRERDAAVAEYVMGWTNIERFRHQLEFVHGCDSQGELRWIPDYTANLNAAWTVDKPGWGWEFDEDMGRLAVTLYTKLEEFEIDIRFSDYLSKAAAYCAARCICALRASGVEVIVD